MTNHFECVVDLNPKKEMYLPSKYIFDLAFNPFFSDCLFLVVTYMVKDNRHLLDKFNFSEYRFVFLVDVADPPDYQIEKWSVLKEYFDDIKHKVFCIGHISNVYTFPTLFIDASAMWSINDRIIYSEYQREHKKKFTCLTGKMHSHRVDVVKAIEDNLLSQCFLSVPHKYHLPSENQTFINSVVDEIDSREGLCPVSSTIPLENYQSPINLVVETSISNSLILISEKTIKPIFSQQSILLIGNPGSLRLLTKKYGFKNLSFLPIEIDDERDYKVKIKKFMQFLENTPLSNLNDMYERNLDSFAFNKEHLKNFNDISLRYFYQQAEKLIV